MANQTAGIQGSGLTREENKSSLSELIDKWMRLRADGWSSDEALHIVGFPLKFGDYEKLAEAVRS